MATVQAEESLDLIQTVFTYEMLSMGFSGAFGGITAISVFYPLNSINSRQKVDPSLKGSMLAVTKQIVERYGLMSLYQGWFASVVSLGTSNFVYFYTYNAMKLAYQVKVLGKKNAPITPQNNLAIAAAAGVVNVLLTTPLWVAGARLSTQTNTAVAGDSKSKPYDGVWDCLSRIYKEEGVEGLWKGVFPSLALVSNPSIQFVAYERLRAPLVAMAEKRGSPPTSFEFFVIGAIAKAIATVATYPIQLSQATQRNDKSVPPKYSGTLDFWQQVMAKEGFVGLFRGMESKLYQTVLTAAFQFMMYERMHQFVMSIMMPGKVVKGGGGH